MSTTVTGSLPNGQVASHRPVASLSTLSAAVPVNTRYVEEGGYRTERGGAMSRRDELRGLLGAYQANYVTCGQAAAASGYAIRPRTLT
jgi:hypothetical protein